MRHPIRHVPVLIFLIALTLPAVAETRAWKSADGNRSVQGEFINRDASGVTIRRSDGKQVTIPLDKLHPDDRAWLDANHPLPGEEVPPKNAVFDQLAFGDNRAEVLKKLLGSKFVTGPANTTFVGRTGLNGVFRTREKIGGLDASLYFDWTDSGGLSEVTLQTDPQPASSLDDSLVPCWKEFIDLLTTLHGRPVNANNRLDLSAIEDGGMSATHLWKLQPTGSILLGAAREGDGYQIAVRFTTENFKPVTLSVSP